MRLSASPWRRRSASFAGWYVKGTYVYHMLFPTDPKLTHTYAHAHTHTHRHTHAHTYMCICTRTTIDEFRWRHGLAFSSQPLSAFPTTYSTVTPRAAQPLPPSRRIGRVRRTADGYDIIYAESRSELIQNLRLRGRPIESDTVGASERVCVFGGIGFSTIVCWRAAAAAPVESW